MVLTDSNLQGLWLKMLMFILCGYALMGKGFAYLFLGEFVLLFGFAIFLLSRRVLLAASDPVLLFWTLFAIWGVCRTVPFIGRYHFDALRDAVLWGYGAFALIIAAFINDSAQIARMLSAYRKFLRWYLPILPVLVFLSAGLRSYLPSWPWAEDVTILYLKSGDASVHLAAAALFLLIFPQKRKNVLMDVVIFIGWILSALMVLITTRGGFVGMTLAITVATFLKAQKIGWKIAAYMLLGAILALTVAESNLITVKVKGRTFDTDQIVENVGSLFGHSSNALERTTQWRVVWWHKIVQYTVFGPYRWTGKGFGVNIALEDGVPGVDKEVRATRSPHNGSMTVLARTGVPGLLLWLLLNGTFVFRLFRAYRLANARGERAWAGVTLWIMCYWLAAFIDMSFDVYIEGPQGGIWFWSIIGFGTAICRVYAHERGLRARRTVPVVGPENVISGVPAMPLHVLGSAN